MQVWRSQNFAQQQFQCVRYIAIVRNLTGTSDEGHTDSDSLQAGLFGVRNLVGTRNFLFCTPVQTGPGAHSASCTMGPCHIFGGKAAGASFRPPTSLSTEITNEYNYTSVPPLRLYSILQGEFYTYRMQTRQTSLLPQSSQLNENRTSWFSR